jgi:hypothetical protein
MVKRLIMILLVLGLLAPVSNYASAAGESKRASSKPSAAAIAADLILLRPVGLIGTLLGTCGFVVTLPVTIPLKKVDSIGQDLVIAPFHYTFERPLGKF